MLPASSRGALLREVHVLQLPHFFPVFLLKLLGRFVLWSESGRGESERGEGGNTITPLLHHVHHLPPLQRKLLLKCTRTLKHAF